MCHRCCSRVLLLLFRHSKRLPLAGLFLLVASRRIHSIFVLVGGAVTSVLYVFLSLTVRAAAVQRLLGHVCAVLCGLLHDEESLDAGVCII